MAFSENDGRVCATNVGSMLTPTDAVYRSSAWSESLTSERWYDRGSLLLANEYFFFLKKKKKKKPMQSSAAYALERALGLVFVGHAQRMLALSETAYPKPLGLSIPKLTGACEGRQLPSSEQHLDMLGTWVRGYQTGTNLSL